MATIGTIAVNVIAKTDKFKGGLDSASKATGGFVASIKSGFSTGFGALTKFAGGFNAITSAIGTAWAKAEQFFSAIIDKADQLEQSFQLAERTGLKFSELSGLERVFADANLEAGLLEGSLEKMLVSLGKQDNEAFAKLGLDQAQLQSQSTYETFLDIADAIAAMPGPIEKAAAAQAIFGKAGQDLLPVLSAGREEISAMVEESKLFGLSIGDAAQKSIVLLNSQIDRVKGLMSGVWTQLTITLAPLLTWAVNMFGNFLELLVDILSEINAFFGLNGIETPTIPPVPLDTDALEGVLDKHVADLEAAEARADQERRWAEISREAVAAADQKSMLAGHNPADNLNAAGGFAGNPAAPGLTAAVTRGSLEAFSAIARFRDANGTNPQVQVAKQQLKEEKQGNKHLKDIHNAVGRMKVAVIPAG